MALRLSEGLGRSETDTVFECCSRRETKEPATAARIACIIAIVGGIVGLKLLHNTSEAG